CLPHGSSRRLNVRLLLSRSPRPSRASARVWGQFPCDTRACEHHLLGNHMALGNLKQLHHQTSYNLLKGLKLFPRAYYTNACNIIRNHWRTAPQVMLEYSTKFGFCKTHRWEGLSERSNRVSQRLPMVPLIEPGTLRKI